MIMRKSSELVIKYKDKSKRNYKLSLLPFVKSQEVKAQRMPKIRNPAAKLKVEAVLKSLDGLLTLREIANGQTRLAKRSTTID